ncbi:DUF1482 family protein, partial [Escherichia coli]
MNTLFILILTVYLNTGESLDAITGMYNSMKECMAAAAEQKIPGNCYPVDKVIH